MDSNQPQDNNQPLGNNPPVGNNQPTESTQSPVPPMRNNVNPKYLVAAAVGILLILLTVFAFIFPSAKGPTSQKQPPQQQPKRTSVEITPTSPVPVNNFDYTIPASASAGDKIEGEIMVTVKKGVTQKQVEAVIGGYDAQIVRTVPQIRLYILKVPVGQEDTILDQLSKNQLIENASRDYVTQIFAAANDQLYGQQWALKNTGQDGGTANADINVEPAWDITQGEGVKIGIIDSGINENHPDLEGKTIAKKAFITDSVEDNLGHGTHVAGIIAADTNNGQGVAGVCPKCQLIIAKTQGDDEKGSGTLAALAEGITWLADQDAMVINGSLGSLDTAPPLQNAVNYAIGKGVIFVAAAGNDHVNQKNYPAAYPGVISVAATDNKDKKASFSNFGSDWVRVAAPGENILSTMPTHPYGLQQTHPGTKIDYAAISGTSMASPVVAGVVGLLVGSTHAKSRDAVIARLYETADKIEGTGTSWEKGRVNAGKALEGAQARRPGQPNGYCISTEHECDSQTAPTDGPASGAKPAQPGQPGQSGQPKQCDKKYTLNNPMKKNFGDPNCDFTKDGLSKLLKELDPKNADKWFNKIVPCESKYNPNAYAPFSHSPDPAGTWGLYQMGRGLNGKNDHGDVEWKLQTSNAVNYNKGIGGTFSYWGCNR